MVSERSQERRGREEKRDATVVTRRVIESTDGYQFRARSGRRRF